MTLVAIYGPNEDNPDFFRKLVFNINQFDNSSVIIASDWNVVQDYRVDTVNYPSACTGVRAKPAYISPFVLPFFFSLFGTMFLLVYQCRFLIH
jgi:hypothetical protein